MRRDERAKRVNANRGTEVDEVHGPHGRSLASIPELII